MVIDGKSLFWATIPGDNFMFKGPEEATLRNLKGGFFVVSTVVIIAKRSSWSVVVVSSCPVRTLLCSGTLTRITRE